MVSSFFGVFGTSEKTKKTLPEYITIVDHEKGQEASIPLGPDRSIPAIALQTEFSKDGEDGGGIRVYDPGYQNTAVVKSSISFIDGDKGILRYRGIPIEELAEKSTFLEVAYLLIYGRLPNKVPERSHSSDRFK